MPRRSRVVVAGKPHHVVQRGNYRQNVFECFEEFNHFCYLVSTYQKQFPVEIVSYCFMNNHLHLVAVPKEERFLGDFLKLIFMRYSQYKNQIKRKKGHLWQGRYYSSVLDDAYLLRAVRYVEQNPTRAQMVDKPWDYPWSSARTHVGLEKDPIIKTTGQERILSLLGAKLSWKEYLMNFDGELDKEIRIRTEKGHAIGTERFVTDLENELGVKLSAGLPGRPKQKQQISVCP